jgi:hypothetical protein
MNTIDDSSGTLSKCVLSSNRTFDSARVELDCEQSSDRNSVLIGVVSGDMLSFN